MARTSQSELIALDHTPNRVAASACQRARPRALLAATVKFDVFCEIQKASGDAASARADHERELFRETREQAMLADELGFRCWWEVEHHGAVPGKGGAQRNPERNVVPKAAPVAAPAALADRREPRVVPSGRHAGRRRARPHVAHAAGPDGVTPARVPTGPPRVYRSRRQV